MPYKIRLLKKRETVPVKILTGFEAVKNRIEEAIVREPRRSVVVFSLLTIGMILISTFWFSFRQSSDQAWKLVAEASELSHQTASSAPGNPNDSKKEDDRSDQLAKAAKLYETVLTNYPATQAAVLARFERGNLHFELGEYDQAENIYLEFIRKEADERNLLPLVHLRLAYLYQKNGNPSSALDHFRIAYNWKGSFNQDQSGFELARLLEETGTKDEAIVIYKKISEDFKESPWAIEAKARLTILEPPPAAPVSPPAISTDASSSPVPASAPTPPAN